MKTVRKNRPCSLNIVVPPSGSLNFFVMDDQPLALTRFAGKTLRLLSWWHGRGSWWHPV